MAKFILDEVPKNKEELKQINRVVGENLRALRISQDMSQDGVGNEIGVSFQQIQKYETGSNRISCPRLIQLSMLLHTSPMAFFHGIEGLPQTIPIDLNFHILRLTNIIRQVQGSSAEQNVRSAIDAMLIYLERSISIYMNEGFDYIYLSE